MTIDFKPQERPFLLIYNFIDCFAFKRRHEIFEYVIKENICFDDDTYLKVHPLDRNYSLIIRNSDEKNEMKMVERYEKSVFHDQFLVDFYNASKVFDGRLEGVTISAALGLERSGKQFGYFIAGRHLCRQEISLTNWTKMCDIEDISDWIDCSNVEESSNLASKIWPISMIEVIITFFVVIVSAF